MEIRKFHTRKDYKMDAEAYYKDRIEELEKLAERLMLENKRLIQELSEKNNYIMMLDKADYEPKG
mgnify:FL=1